MFAELSVKSIFIFMDLPMTELIKLAKIKGVMHEADHAYSIRSTCTLWSHWLATDVAFIGPVINSPSSFTYYLDLSNFNLESGLLYFRVFTICLLFVSAAGCHCFDLTDIKHIWIPLDKMNRHFQYDIRLTSGHINFSSSSSETFVVYEWILKLEFSNITTSLYLD